MDLLGTSGWAGLGLAGNRVLGGTQIRRGLTFQNRRLFIFFCPGAEGEEEEEEEGLDALLT